MRAVSVVVVPRARSAHARAARAVVVCDDLALQVWMAEVDPGVHDRYRDSCALHFRPGLIGVDASERPLLGARGIVGDAVGGRRQDENDKRRGKKLGDETPHTQRVSSGRKPRIRCGSGMFFSVGFP